MFTFYFYRIVVVDFLNEIYWPTDCIIPLKFKLVATFIVWLLQNKKHNVFYTSDL